MISIALAACMFFIAALCILAFIVVCGFVGGITGRLLVPEELLVACAIFAGVFGFASAALWFRVETERIKAATSHRFTKDS